MSASRRLILAALVAPSAPVLMIAFGRVLGVGRTNFSDPNSLLVLGALLLGSYACSVILGIPACLLLRGKRATALYIYATAALLTGAAALPLGLFGSLIWIYFSRGTDAFARGAHIYMDLGWKIPGGSSLTALVYLPVGILFWFIARPEQP